MEQYSRDMITLVDTIEVLIQEISEFKNSNNLQLLRQELLEQMNSLKISQQATTAQTRPIPSILSVQILPPQVPQVHTSISPSIPQANTTRLTPVQGVQSTETQAIQTHYYDLTDFRFEQFWRHRPQQWFEMLERRFSVRGIRNDDDRYFVVVRNLLQDLLLELDDTLKALPFDNKYNTLRKALIDKFLVKEDDKLDKLFSNLNMGHKKPSEFLQFLFANGGGFIEREKILNIYGVSAFRLTSPSC